MNLLALVLFTAASLLQLQPHTASGDTAAADNHEVRLLDRCPQPNGVTDDTLCIQAAIDYLHSRGGGLLFLGFTKSCYTVDHLKVYSYITVYSDDRATCVRRIAGPASGISSVFYNDVESAIKNVHFSNFTIDGNRMNVTGPVGGTIGIDLFGASNSSIDNMTIKNAYVDGIYIDCAGPGRLIAGDGLTIGHTLVTNSQRNNVSVICGRNTHIEDSELSYANGSLPEAGVDVEENVAGQLVAGFSIIRTDVHHNHKEGVLIIPGYDPEDTLLASVLDDDVHDNGSFGLRAVDYTHVNHIVVKGGRYINNGDAAIILSGWRSSSISDEIALGSKVGLSIANSVVDSSVGPGFLAGLIYDLEVTGPFSNALLSGVVLGRGIIGGAANVSGFLSLPSTLSTSCIPVSVEANSAITQCGWGLTFEYPLLRWNIERVPTRPGR